MRIELDEPPAGRDAPAAPSMERRVGDRVASPRLGPISLLALRAQRGDRAALEEFVAATHRYVRCIARSRLSATLRRIHDADDLASLAWASILRGLPDLRVEGDGPLCAWLRRIVSNLALEEERAWSSQRRSLANEEALEGHLGRIAIESRALASSRHAEPLRSLEARGDLSVVFAALGTLDANCSEAFWLVEFDGCSFVQAAKLLRASEAGARKWHAKAMARVLLLLGDES